MLYRWDAKDYKYKIVVSSTPKDQIGELEEYVFLVRNRLGELPPPQGDDLTG